LSGYLSKIYGLLLFSGLLIHKTQAQKLRFLVPDAAVVQFAGSIGYLSGGIGYDLFKNQRGSLDLSYGYVPKSKGGELNIVTAKFAYRPFVIKLKDWGKIYPINPGFFATYTFQKELSFIFNRTRYAKDYYYWSEALRPHLSFSNEVELDAGKLIPGSGFKAISVYTEFNTNDYYLINYLQNTSTLSLPDVFQLGLGLKLKF